MHRFTHIHRHIHIHITYARIHTYISINRCTRAHDFAHVHAIVKMQLKIVLVHAYKRTREQTHAYRHTCLRAQIYADTHMYAVPLSPICMLSLVMSQLKICLQVTINPFPTGHWSTQTPGKQSASAKCMKNICRKLI